MRTRRLNLALLGISIFAGAGSVLLATEPVNLSAPEVTDALAVVRIAGLQAHINFLADDKLEGREAGTRGHELAADYVASQFESMGLEPAGDGRSFFQQVTFRVSKTRSATFTLNHKGKEQQLTYVDDFAVFPNPGNEAVRISGEVVFVGYGVSAPGLGYDDYAGVDVRGKIVAFAGGTPAHFPAMHRSHLEHPSTKQHTAAQHGAIGIISLSSPGRRFPWMRLAKSYSQRGFTTWLSPQGQPGDSDPGLEAWAMLNKERSAEIFEHAGGSWEKTLEKLKQSGKPQSHPLNLEATITIETEHANFTSPNVAAVLPGSDPALKDEYVVFSAHLDHIGTSEEGEDRINNGAYDNATGTATMIEVARAFASLPHRPRRSILFLAVTAEEKGLLGSEYYANHPSVEGRLVADINMDMFLMLYPIQDVAALGSEHSTLERVMRQALDYVGLELGPDPVPQFNLFTRSDHYSFVKQGVPSTFLVTGFKSSDPGVDGKAVFDNWFQTTYHNPNDDATQDMHLESGVKVAQANFLAGYIIANEDEPPHWKEGNFFGETFGANARH